jgi:hypothetical protein
MNKMEYRISKLQNTAPPHRPGGGRKEKIIAFQSESKESMEIRASRARSAREAASPTAIAIEVTDLVSGVTTIFASARRAGEFLNASNSTIMNKIKGKNNKPYKERFFLTLSLVGIRDQLSVPPSRLLINKRRGGMHRARYAGATLLWCFFGRLILLRQWKSASLVP